VSVQVKIPKILRSTTNGEAVAEVKGFTVHECIKALIRQYPGLEGQILDNQGMILLKWMIYINNTSAGSSDELSHPVKEGDVIEFLPMVAGG
jgi:molybdopterin converting factor small subunit